jgi:CheY-like chemotaxis protein
VPKKESTTPLILVVDDHEDNRAMYAEYLRFVGYRVETATDGREAIVKARGLKPDVMVIDLSMPGMDGCETTEMLKGLPETKGIWVIGVTGHTSLYDERRARAAGINEFAIKPLLPSKLGELVAAGFAERTR